ncbi:hypothetical protein PSH97_08995 [Pseudomonas cucumis]|uniref:Secreted protein n=1 Tax=Pseudomonas cucumis TaxID=2954082 RepID=A0ABY9F3F9_9PSED|nr:hypothetical protein [Pseudomonas cucumis]WLG86637.1 hypothetical protein PSH97_08995 [Pseudomonas cucumis]
MSSDNTQQRLTFGLAVFVFAVWKARSNGQKKSHLNRRLKGKNDKFSSECVDYPHRPPGSEINSGYAADRRQHCFAMKRGRSGWGISRTGLVRWVQRHYPTD